MCQEISTCTSSCACFLSFTSSSSNKNTHTHLYTHLFSSPKLLYPEPSCSARVGPFHSLLSMPLTSERTGSAPLRGLARSRTLDVDIFGAAGPPHPGNQAPLSPYPSLFAQPLFPPRPTLLLFRRGTGRKLERQRAVLCSLLGCAAGGRLPTVHQSSHSLSLPLFL